MSHTVLEGCFHEQQWGEFAAEKRMWESHRSSTASTLNELKTAINDIKLILQGQAAQLNEVSSIKTSLLDINKQMLLASQDSKESVKRVHERIEKVETTIMTHKDHHCVECKNEVKLFEYVEECETVGTTVNEMKKELEILYPMAKGLRFLQEKFWILFLTGVGLVVIANLLGIEVGVIIDKWKGK